MFFLPEMTEEEGERALGEREIHRGSLAGIKEANIPICSGWTETGFYWQQAIKKKWRDQEQNPDEAAAGKRRKESNFPEDGGVVC